MKRSALRLYIVNHPDLMRRLGLSNKQADMINFIYRRGRKGTDSRQVAARVNSTVYFVASQLLRLYKVGYLTREETANTRGRIKYLYYYNTEE